MFSTAEECKKNEEKFDNLEKYNEFYGILTTEKEIEDEIYSSWVAPGPKMAPIREMDAVFEKLRFPEVDFYSQTLKGLQNSIHYMFNKYIMCFYVGIRGKNLTIKYIYNENWKNPRAADIKMPKIWNHAKSSDVVDLAAVFTLSKKYVDSYTMDFTYFQLRGIMETLISEREISDCDFLIAGRDRLNIKRDLTESSEELMNSIAAPLQKEFLHVEYCPIFSFCFCPRFADIPFPTPPDWIRILESYPKNNCSNDYIPSKLEAPDWQDRIAKAVFRGSYTGQFADERNPRIKLTVLNSRPEWKKLIDAGISGWKGRWRGRKSLQDREIRFLDPKYMHLEVAPLSHSQQAKYKYILYVEGNIAAYRGAFLFSMGSVVMWVKSRKYFLWFEPLLKNKVNCIIIEPDLSNLQNMILWLQSNDEEAQKIAAEGGRFYQEFLSKEPILDYMQMALNDIQKYNCA